VIDEQEEALLGSAARPIVLLRRRGAAALAEAGALAPSVAGGLHELGLMLPSTPVQHLLMALLARPLVMTSGNISEEPIIADVREAHQALGQVADAFLDNNRAIRSRYDDSVLRVIDGRAFFVRRARGYAPVPLKVHRALGQGATGGQEAQKAEGARHAKLQDAKAREGGILAVGPEQKSSFCLMRNHRAFVSQHLGDLEGSSAFAAWHSTLNLYQRLFDLPYDLIACDPHPEYLSTKWARAQPERRIEVQHHHAHIASVLAEELAAQTRTQVGAVIGVAFDGSGYGSDGSIWGGEVLIATLENFERFACLRPCPLPGGKAAITRPERMAYSYLLSLELSEHPGARGLLTDIGPEGLGLLERIVSQRVNSPLTSSMGRLFDAASALAGVCGISSYEGQAAVEFEAALYDPTTGMPSREPEGSDVGPAPRYRFELRQGENMGAGLGLIIEPRPVLASLLDDCAAELPTSIISLRFHEAVASLIVEVCQQARARYGLEDVALGGGVFMNRYLLTRAIALLRAEGFTVLLNRELPANDGCISYGQAIVAAARLARERGEDILVKAVDDATHDATR
jgi:hydrogenase maturation protein HypF